MQVLVHRESEEYNNEEEEDETSCHPIAEDDASDTPETENVPTDVVVNLNDDDRSCS